MGGLAAVVWVVLGQIVPPELGSQPGWLNGATPIEGAVARCKGCHDKDITDPEPLYLPFDGWVSTMMGNSIRDPLFRAAVVVANQDVPGVGQFCLRCHAPQAYVRGHTIPTDGGALDTIDAEGVTCDACHRSVLAPPDAGFPNDAGAPPVIGNANLYFERGVVKFGPYDAGSSSGHDMAYGSLVTSSELCGQCHQVWNPLVPWRREDGGLIGPRFPLDTTYDEWKFSAYSAASGGQRCQDCHMPQFINTDGGVAYPVGKLGPLQNKPRRHVFVGGNLWGLRAVQQANPELSVYAEQFAVTEDFTLASLRAAAQLEMTAPTSALRGGALQVHLKVTNRSGHKLPTGYADGRRVFVQVALNGAPVSGAFTDAGTLVVDSQLRVYEARHGRVGVGEEEHLAQHDLIVKDTRIPPTGARATPTTAPVGTNWFTLADGGLADFDSFDVTVPNLPTTGGATATVTATLYYQSTTPEYVHFLASENHTDDAGQKLLGIFNALGGAPPIVMATVQRTVALTADPDGGAGGGAGGGSSGGGAGGGTAGGPDSGAAGAGGAGGGGAPASGCGCQSVELFSGAAMALGGLLARRRRRV